MKISLPITLITLLMLLSLQALAHSPDAIEVSYASTEDMPRMMIIEVDHDVSNTESHFVEEIEVYVNDKEIAVQEYSKQWKDGTQRAVFFVADLKDGDQIEIHAYCSISGEIKKKLKADLPDKW